MHCPLTTALSRQIPCMIHLRKKIFDQIWHLSLCFRTTSSSSHDRSARNTWQFEGNTAASRIISWDQLVYIRGLERNFSKFSQISGNHRISVGAWSHAMIYCGRTTLLKCGSRPAQCIWQLRRRWVIIYFAFILGKWSFIAI